MDLEFLSPHDPEAVTVFMDMGLRFVERDTKGVKLGNINCIYDVIDEQRFFLSVIKYGMKCEVLNEHNH